MIATGKGSYLLLFLPLILVLFGQTCAKIAGRSLFNGLVPLLCFFGTYFFFGLRGFVWAIVLKRLKLSVAYPVLSLSFPLVLLLSFLMFGEAVSLFNILGAGLIVFGIVLISFGEARLKNGASEKGKSNPGAGKIEAGRTSQ